MTLAELRRIRYEQPWRPLRLYITEGRHFEVLYPELLAVFGHSVIVGNPGRGASANWPVCDEYHDYGIDQIDRVEYLPEPATAAVG